MIRGLEASFFVITCHCARVALGVLPLPLAVPLLSNDTGFHNVTSRALKAEQSACQWCLN